MNLRRLPLLLLLLSLLTLGCEDPDESPTQYSAGSVRWGRTCDPFEPVAGSRFGPADEPCIELVLEGYYTRGDLTAIYHLGDQEVGRTRIEFSLAGALAERMERDAAESRVTFQLHHEGQPLPPSNLYYVEIQRAGTQVARYPFEVADPGESR